jgi:hypothetical protein
MNAQIRLSIIEVLTDFFLDCLVALKLFLIYAAIFISVACLASRIPNHLLKT